MSERVNKFWKNWHLELVDEIESARRRLEYVEGQMEDDKLQVNVQLAKIQRMKHRHKKLWKVGIQKFKNSSYAMESKKHTMQA